MKLSFGINEHGINQPGCPISRPLLARCGKYAAVKIEALDSRESFPGQTEITQDHNEKKDQVDGSQHRVVLSGLIQFKAAYHCCQKRCSRNERLEQDGFVVGMGSFAHCAHSIQCWYAQGRGEVPV